MKRSIWICRDRCGDKSCQLFTSEPANEGGEWFSYINGSSEPGRPTNVYLPPSVALALAGRELAPGDKVEIPLEAAAGILPAPRPFRASRPVRQSA
ncbi:MAG TPA: hypothetical protein VGP76_17895 [Planctomycetaceae bacterium]|jgi:hypothetical protein|nr:hypothetical protein [Planctomycetaceae bacterium]